MVGVQRITSILNKFGFSVIDDGDLSISFDDRNNQSVGMSGNGNNKHIQTKNTCINHHSSKTNTCANCVIGNSKL